MRVIFAGTPEFAAQALEAILAAGHAVPLVLTQPDRPAGRGQQLAQSAVKKLAQARDIPIYQPERFHSAAHMAPLLSIAGDVMVVAAYGLILPAAVLNYPRHGCLNIHASLLPRWRGAAPIQRAILAGDTETGVCIMQMDTGLDTGPVVSRDRVAIGPDDTAGVLQDRLARLGAAAIVRALAQLVQAGELPAVPQAAEGVTYAPKVGKEEARIDWQCGAAELRRQIRAFNPVPGAFARIDGVVLKIWRARTAALEECPEPGRIAAPGGMFVVGCGGGTAVVLDEVQPAGGRRMPGGVYLNGRPEVVNRSFGT